MPRPITSTVSVARAKASKARAEFRDAHERGMASIKRRDFDALEKAISDEAAAIDEMGTAIESMNKAADVKGAKRKR